jgi:sodium-independent sulfate anion transporter 11
MSTVVGSIILDVQNIYPDIPGPQIALSIAIICGSIVTFMGLARLGFIVDFIPLPAITAFMAGSSIVICSGQVKQLLGETANFSTSAPGYQIIIDTLKSLPTSQGCDAAMGVTALVTLYILRSACNYGARRHPHLTKLFFFLGALRTVFIIVLFTLISFAVNAHRRESPAFALVGTVPRGFGHAGVPVLKADVIKLFVPKLPACVIALLIEHIAVSKAFGRINNYTIDPSQELIAIGITNLLGPFVGAYPATGAFSRSAIQSKSGARSPFAGIITACIVLIAMYALTGGLYYIPKATLSGVIIHAVGDLIVPPNTIYQFWLIAPLDAIIFAVGLIVAVVSTIPNSIYTTVCLSVAVLLFRHAKAPGHFLDQTWINDGNNQRPLFLSSEETKEDPSIQVEKPRPGVFLFRFAEGFNYSNANHYSDTLSQTICKQTRRTNIEAYAKKGDRPWNDPDSASADEPHLPILRAVILDFSAVNNVDVTCVQNLVDVRSQMDRRSAPVAVQWHFANVKSRWTKRALRAAGFGSLSAPPVNNMNEEGAEAPCDAERGDIKISSPLKESDKRGEPAAKNLNGSSSAPDLMEDNRGLVFHADVASALHFVDVYLAADPVA